MLRSPGRRFTLAVVSCVLLVATFLSPCRATALEARAKSKHSPIPTPLSINPAQNWDGIDGQWSTLALAVGEPAQYVRVLVSTASQQTWVIFNMACEKNQTDANNVTKLVLDDACAESRGRVFDVTKSNTWNNRGFYQLWTEKNMGLDGNGKYGYDTVGLGYPGEKGPTLKNTTVGALITPNFWLGHFGVNPKPTNFSAFEDPSTSYMTYLFKNKLIPSVSFAYTAGARYRFTSILSSLTLGGYDTSRYIPNDLTFKFAPDNERDLVVPVVGMRTSSATKSNVSLLKDPFPAYIDSTLAELYLPLQVCQAFEDAFGLKYDNDTDLYLVDDVQHQQLLAENPNVTFTLGQKYNTNSTIDIVLPYAAFDLRAKPPYRGLKNESYFFPIRRGKDESQFVFGRTLLQEAYLVVDWERHNFSIYQAAWVYGATPNIVPIISPTLTGEIKKHHPKAHLSTGAVIGIAMGGGFGAALICFAIGWWFWTKRRDAKYKAALAALEQKAAANKAGSENPSDPPLSPTDPEEGSNTFPEGTNVFPKAELPANGDARLEYYPEEKTRDVSGLAPIAEVEDNDRQIFEMEGDMPTPQEADGRQLSEKESMMVRERIYNGIDPLGPPEVSPTTDQAPRRLAPVSPSEVAMVRNVQPANISPVTPRTPRDRGLLEADDTFFQPPQARIPRDGRSLEPEDTIMSPISPLEGSSDSSRRRFSYEQ